VEKNVFQAQPLDLTVAIIDVLTNITTVILQPTPYSQI